MPLPRREEDAPQEEKPIPCAACGKPTSPSQRTEVWGYLLCGGETQMYGGCMAELCAALPFDGEKEFTRQWVAKKKARAA